MRSLQQFQNTSGAKLFRDATELPAFFQNNLIDPSRVVKVFVDDPQANIRVFYYQYLKLCFELETVEYEYYINKIESIINNESFKFMFYQDDDPYIYNDMQFKHFIMEFFGILGGDQNYSVERALDHYPIMDIVFIYFFRAILIFAGITDGLDSFIDREELLKYLGSYFNVEISIHDLCIKFVETDIFVYEENPHQVFMAYMDASFEEEKGPEEDQSGRVVNNSKIAEEVQEKKQIVNLDDAKNTVTQNLGDFTRKLGSEINTSYISSEFVDFTTHHNLSAFGKASKEEDINESKNSSSLNQENDKYDSNNHNFRAYEKNKEQINLPEMNDSNYDFKSSDARSFIVEDEKSINKYYEPVKDVSSTYKANLRQGQSLVTTQADNYVSAKLSLGSFEKNKSEQYSSFNSPTYKSSFNTNSQGQFPLSTFSKNYPTDDHYSANFNHYDLPKTSQQAPNEFKGYLNKLNNNSHQYVKYGSPAGSIYGLNVSLEFTNSLIMKAMAEPYRSNVRTIRNRARDFRNSLKSFLK